MYFNIPRKKFCHNRQIWWASYSSHEENNIGMSNPFHDPDLSSKTENMNFPLMILKAV